MAMQNVSCVKTASHNLPVGDLKVPANDQRIDYLQRIARGEVSPLIVVSGLPGSGKTTLLHMLGREQATSRGPVYTAATRYMPRERRPSDTTGDRPWTHAVGHADGEDRSGPESIIFANQKYQGYYGFPGASIRKSINEGESPVMLVTSYSEMTQLAEALHGTVPVAPLVTLRVEVPQEVLPSRILNRAGSHPEEHRERIEKLGNLVRADLLQTPLLNQVYDTRVIWNVTQDEVRRFGYFGSQIKALSPDAVAAMVVEASVNAKLLAAEEARDILTPRKLTYGMKAVPDSIVDVLDRVLLPVANDRLSPAHTDGTESALVIKAGLAAAIYLGDLGRPVSPDIDFTLVDSPLAKPQMELVMDALCHDMPEWTDGRNKAVYHCEGLKSEARSKDGVNVELDAILITRVQPDVKGFCFVCQHDEHDLFHRRMVETPAGYRFGMVPPEQLCVEKLLAGRGPDINKFDLFDASGLLANYRLNANLIKKMVEMQGFNADLDSDAIKVIKDNDFMLADDVLSQIGITEPLMQLCAKKLIADDREGTMNLMREVAMTEPDFEPLANTDASVEPIGAGIEPWEKKSLSVKALKQLAFLSSVERSLTRIEAVMDDRVFPVGAERVSIGERFGDVNVARGLDRLRAQLALLAEYHIGSTDSYVNRGTNKGEMDQFFSKLDQQRTRLSGDSKKNS